MEKYYAFEIPDVPAKSEYLEVKYSVSVINLTQYHNLVFYLIKFTMWAVSVLKWSLNIGVLADASSVDEELKLQCIFTLLSWFLSGAYSVISSITVRYHGLGLCLWGMMVISVLCSFVKMISEYGVSALKISMGWNDSLLSVTC